MSMEYSHPLQSKAWREFRKAWGNEILETKYGIITSHKIPLISFKIGIFEKGPQPTQEMLADLKKVGRENNLLFIKLEPNVAAKVGEKLQTDGNKLRRLLEENGAVPGKTLFTPTTFWIDLTKSEEELMKSFSSKTRYNIRLAERKGVKVTEDNSERAFEKYLNLTFETTKRQGFYAHTPRYHKLMWKHLRPQLTSMMLKSEGRSIAHLLTAKYKGEMITTWILFAYKDFLYYPYGASTDKYKEVMANNLMMWEAIRFGKKLGLKTFDLWGREPGKGFTKFKEGYNPAVVEMLGTWDLVINQPLYKIYRLLETTRWKILRAKAKFGLNKSTF
jgi:lipid II:glycine glycyltransferase (peptidoglycan interpeptide bridge formation enzyme)